MCAELGVAKEKKSIIKGSHKYEDLLPVLDSFIHKFLLCPKCKLPEISLFAEKKLLKCSCRACGKVATMDNTHRVSTYITKNIPKEMSEIDIPTNNIEPTDQKKTKKGKKGKKVKKNKEGEGEDDDELTLTTKTDPGMVSKYWFHLAEDPDKLTHKSPEVEQVIETVIEYIKDKGEELKIDELKEEIRNQCIAIGPQQDLKYYITFNSVFSINIINEFPKYKEIFKSYVGSDGELGVKHFLMVVSDFFAKVIKKAPKLEIAIPTFLKLALDAEIVNEHTYLEWEGNKKWKLDKASSLYSKKNERKVKKAGEQFFTWLKEAEEAESEEDEEESEEEKKEMTEEEFKLQKQKELIEKEKLRQEQELLESKTKQEQEKAEELAEKAATGDEKKIDVLKVEVEDENEDDLDIDNI